MLCVVNLSPRAQPAELPLHPYAGTTPVELLGGVRYSPISELPYSVTLGPYGFYWFHLVDPRP